jgi:tRNA pseudouridine55 synthase
MGRSRPRGRDVAGIVLLDKPQGLTSNAALQQVKRLFDAAKAGHTGSLDPLATGMLPICLGAATRLSGLLLDAAKEYRVTAEFGAATDTGDADGRVVERRAIEQPTQRELEAALARFRGEIDQVPPMFSALKRGGRPLYELARRGLEVEREPRRVVIHALTLEAVEWPRVRLAVACSKGTYIRSLVGDLAEALGGVAHVAELRRLAVEPFVEAQMVGLPTLEAAAARGLEDLDRLVLPADAALEAWPRVALDADAARRLRHGQAVPAAAGWPVGAVRVYAAENGFLGIGEVTLTGQLLPRKIFVRAAW